MKELKIRIDDVLHDTIKKAAGLDKRSINKWAVKALRVGCRASARAAISKAKLAALHEWQAEQMGKPL